MRRKTLVYFVKIRDIHETISTEIVHFEGNHSISLFVVSSHPTSSLKTLGKLGALARIYFVLKIKWYTLEFWATNSSLFYVHLLWGQLSSLLWKVLLAKTKRFQYNWFVLRQCLGDWKPPSLYYRWCYNSFKSSLKSPCHNTSIRFCSRLYKGNDWMAFILNMKW